MVAYGQGAVGGWLPSMFQYFSKFLIQILPSVTATVIGGFIVHTWISPRAAVSPPRPAAVSTATPGIAGEQVESGIDAAGDATPEGKSAAKPLNIKGGPIPTGDTASKDSPKDTTAAAGSRLAAKPAPAEKPAADKAGSDGNHTGKSQPNPSPGLAAIPAATPAAAGPEVETTAAIASPAGEKRSASELARTALERLRTGETPRSELAKAASEPHHAGPQPAFQRSEPMLPQQAVLPMGPPINILAPRHAEAAVEAETAEDDASRVVPPGEIPQMRRTADDQGEGRPTIADDFVSATRSMLRAVLPK